jgi:phosphate transport system protein
VAELSSVAVGLAHAAQQALLSREPRRAAFLRHNDGAADILYRRLLAIPIDPRWSCGVATGVDVAVVGGHYQSFADHAVRIRERFVGTNGRRRRRLDGRVSAVAN